MEEAKRPRLIHKEKLDHVPELLHRIQLLLHPKQAARTCVLSKSWLHAWCTIPNLRFCDSGLFASEEQRRKIERTLLRYIRDDIPFEKIDLSIDIENHELASFAEKWIPLIATKSCLKELCLSVGYGIIGSFTMPDEIFSSKKLHKMSISGCENYTKQQMKESEPKGVHFLLINRNPVINCVALRVLKLWHVSISEEVFEKLLSTCILLEKIVLSECKVLKNIKVRNLRYLCELCINACKQDHILEINDVPNIRSFSYSSCFQRNPLTLNIDSLGCVTELSLDGLVKDDSFLDMLKSKFHSLESLTLGMQSWYSECLDITCHPLKRLLIIRSSTFTKIKVYAPKLNFFHYDGIAMPSLVFPAIAPAQIKLELDFFKPIDLFFLNIAEVLMLSSEFDIKISSARFDLVEPLKIDMDDLRTSFTIPATNVQHLYVKTFKGSWEQEHSSFFDAFFSICHPKHVVAYRDTRYKDKNYFCKLIVKEVMEKNTRNGFWPDYLKEVQIKNDGNGGNWETLTNSWKTWLDESSLFSYKVEFKLDWF